MQKNKHKEIKRWKGKRNQEKSEDKIRKEEGNNVVYICPNDVGNRSF